MGYTNNDQQSTRGPRARLRRLHRGIRPQWLGLVYFRCDPVPLMKLLFFCDKERHLICTPYSVHNLHEMARKLNIKRCWFHPGTKPHYDIPKMRQKEISAQCTVVSEREILRMIKEGLKHQTLQIGIDF